MTKWNLPPIAKVYEALAAVADGRVRLTGRNHRRGAFVRRDKSYTVKWSSDGSAITSNDNATRWQGYAGYPIIAVLLHTGRIPYDPQAAATLANVPWHTLEREVQAGLRRRSRARPRRGHAAGRRRRCAPP